MIFPFVSKEFYKAFYSRPKIPLTETTRGVKEEWHILLHHSLFSSLADDRIAATPLCECDRVCQKHYHLRLPYPSDTKISYQPHASLASCTPGSRITSLYKNDARTLLHPLFCCDTGSPVHLFQVYG